MVRESNIVVFDINELKRLVFLHRKKFNLLKTDDLEYWDPAGAQFVDNAPPSLSLSLFLYLSFPCTLCHHSRASCVTISVTGSHISGIVVHGFGDNGSSSWMARRV